ncbi:outer membrane protein assembly factor BamD [Kingella negevensis]|uniref:tetratricopeptide repeat protein n=1 Tax=Kingella negevensis TaxID=1522312 RepID=UPI00254FFEE3|nr:outer membrane protein assembly factor BamD [Kingella negevensis]MDK4706772.1 outer membrane protein assembly factor BamD [Kingella negevensis]MDK4708921.1 outer membrane protein assembly factor BamD [Kingella negevensis]
MQTKTLLPTLIAFSLSACNTIAPNSSLKTQTPTPVYEEEKPEAPIPYPTPSHQEEYEQLAMQVAKLEQKVEQLQTRVRQLEKRPVAQQPTKKQSKPQTQRTAAQPTITLSDPLVNLLETAQQQYKKGDYRAATQTLHDADSGGDGSHTAQQAMYLLLQSHQKLNNCQSVINIGQRYATRFSDSNTAAEALYSVGECQWKIQQQDIAKDTWRNLQRSYPNSSAAKRAQTKLTKYPKMERRRLADKSKKQPENPQIKKVIP